MKIGTLVRVQLDGKWQTATVVYHGLDGYGVKLGVHTLSPEDVELIELGGPLGPEPPEGYEWLPDVMLDDVEWGAVDV